MGGGVEYGFTRLVVSSGLVEKEIADYDMVNYGVAMSYHVG